MRLFFLLVLTALVVGFAYYNKETVTVNFGPDYAVTASIALIAGVGYVLGMVSGMTLVRMVQRSANSFLKPQKQR